MQFRKPILAMAAIVALAAPAAWAHRMWLLPSSTVISGTDNWVTVDAAVSNDLFFFDHRPMAAIPTITQPDGSEGKVEHHAVGQFRATFDVHLTQQGTYRIAVVNEGVFGRYTLNGETKMLPRGTTKAQLATAIPAGATNVQTSETLMRNEIFVTQGAPTKTIFKPTGRGIELVPVTHPNDLVAGEAATFQFLLDGKPAAGLYITAIPGGIRYRDSLKQMDLRTDSQGQVKITWPEPGMYWLNVTPNAPQERREPGAGGPQPGGAAPQPGAGGPQPGPGMGVPSGRRVSYTTTLEVLAP
ncbi:DUF4198 domain-containing protein [Sphingomonas sp. HT-1]|jgi:uncharacterized GH25 family protein|uniref:DUF4198 domain-containing protein n=1 Tax=unclassified Sphingomonas TaxID=196159 RepID=UPI0002ECF3FE|nr:MULTISPECIES: DUF4198 domain-containing protein [unclassified Sphingomonas]KTF69555.1 ABC transporter permease [Sphingomonas sp. WG]